MDQKNTHCRLDVALFFVLLVPLLTYLLAVATYAYSPVLLDHYESLVASVSYLLATNQPLYHDADSASRYSALYGPALYMLNYLALRVYEPTMLTAKLAGIISALLGILFTFWGLTSLTSLRKAIALTGLMAIYLSFFQLCSYWNRADSFLWCFSASAIFVCVRGPSFLKPLIVGLAVGAAAGLKIHALCAFFPHLVLIYRFQGAKGLILTAALALLAFLAPFLHPNIDPVNMAFWLIEASRHGLVWSTFVDNVAWLAWLASPLILFTIWLGLLSSEELLACLRSNLDIVLAGITGAALTCIAASKPGSSAHHLIPFVPLMAYGVAYMARVTKRHASTQKAGRTLFMLIILGLALGHSLFAVKNNMDTIRRVRERDARVRAVISDLKSVLALTKGAATAMGVGSDRSYPDTFYKPVLVYAGNPVFVEPGALMDMDLAGLPIPRKTLDYLASGAIKYFLVPRGETPFSMHSMFNGSPLFAASFRDAFRTSYCLTSSSRFFDIYQSKNQLRRR